MANWKELEWRRKRRRNYATTAEARETAGGENGKEEGKMMYKMEYGKAFWREEGRQMYKLLITENDQRQKG
jgi:hypothetical protein